MYEEEDFRLWLLKSRGGGTVASRLTNCRVVKKWEGDLDEQFEHDRLLGLLNRLTYTKEDERYSRPPRHKIPIDGNIYNGTATYKAAVSLYKQFREEEQALVTSMRGLTNSSVAANSDPNRLPVPRNPQPCLISQPAKTEAVSAPQLAEWRRKLIKCLVEMETNESRAEMISVAERISRLQRSGAIPRETAAMMRTVTEMRNAAEYQDNSVSRRGSHG